MKVKFILPALAEAGTDLWRPIKYSLFPPLGLATLASHLNEDDEAVLQDQHVETLFLDDEPDLVVIQVYITNAYRAYAIADHYRRKGVYVALGGLHVTAMPEEAMAHADTIFTGPADESFPRFIRDLRSGCPEKIYISKTRSMENIPAPRRDLIKRHFYFVPNSIVVSRGCPHHCNFCYKDGFYEGGRSFYTQRLDNVLREIESLPGRHLYFLDDHLLGDPFFARGLFDGMKGMKRVFQGAATVQSIISSDLIERAADAGLRSLFVGFETFSQENLKQSNKNQNLLKDYEVAVKRLHSLGIMINGSFVFGLDNDDKDVFKRTVDWGIKHSIATATYHILTPYPGTALFKKLDDEGRIMSRDWDFYDTRHVVYRTKKLSGAELKDGYDYAYSEFYRWSNIWHSSMGHDALIHKIEHLLYTSAWKKFESFWNLLIRMRQLNNATPLLELLFSGTASSADQENDIKSYGVSKNIGD